MTNTILHFAVALRFCLHTYKHACTCVQYRATRLFSIQIVKLVMHLCYIAILHSCNTIYVQIFEVCKF